MNHDRVMLLIDADNVSLDVIEQAVPWVHKHYGGPHVRRAYCTAESAVKHQGAFKRLSIRPMVNLAAGKNSTDIALAVDAIDLVIAEMPEVVVIASSDSDFAPLVARLREKGCKVVGIGQSGKTGAETQGIYDDYEVLVHNGEGRTRPAAAAPAPARRAPARAAKKAPAKAVPKPSAAPAPRRAPAKKVAATAASGDDRAAAMLEAMPELARGEELDLRVAVERLRKLGLLSKSGSSTKLFSQFPQHFLLTPADTPQKVKAAV